MLNQGNSAFGSPLVYLDSAATSLMPQMVIDAMSEYEETTRSNIHRGIHRFAETSTELYEEARECLAQTIGCAAKNVILTHGATESINMMARGWAANVLRKKDVVALFVDNHHANIVPWQMLAAEKGMELVFVEIERQGNYDELSWERALSLKPKLVVLPHVCNVTGFMHSVSNITDTAHSVGACVLVDCAQGFGHVPLDVGAWGMDAAVGSSHKAYGPFGIGFLYANDQVIDEMKPVYGGGGMVSMVTREGFTAAEGTAAFEAGTPAVSAAVGMKASLVFIDGLGIEALAAHSSYLCDETRRGLDLIPGIKPLGERRGRDSSMVSFVSERIHPHDIAAGLDRRGIAVRAGHHCAMPLHESWGIPATVRVSFGVYNTRQDVESFLEALEEMHEERKDGVVFSHRK